MELSFNYNVSYCEKCILCLCTIVCVWLSSVFLHVCFTADPTSSHFTMEELVSTRNQDSSTISLGFTRTNAINHDESESCTTVPHHSLSVSLSDPEALLSSQV